MNAEDEAFGVGFGPVDPEKTPWTLIERVQHGDRDSRDRLCRVYGPLIRNVYLARLPVQDRMDLCQEVFRTVFQRINEFRQAQSGGPSFRPWLRKIAQNKVGNYLSRKRRQGLTVSNSDLEALIPDDDHRPDDSNPSELDEQTELVRAAFEEAAAEFEPRTVEAFRRVVLGDEPVAGVAEALGMSPNAVYVAKGRVLARIRSILNELGEPVETDPDPPGNRAESNHGRDTR
jgi:RNA polymerase sigma-70 factor (ECF subfamily)